MKNLNHKASEAVTKELSQLIPLTKNELIKIKNLFRRYNVSVYQIYRPILNEFIASIKPDTLKEFRGKIQSFPSLEMIKLPAAMRGQIVQAVEECGKDKEDFELGRYIMDWYGIERKSARYFNDYIPQDHRCRYEENTYPGPTREEFTLDHIALSHDDQVQKEISEITDYFYDSYAMISAVENNKWSIDKVGN